VNRAAATVDGDLPMIWLRHELWEDDDVLGYRLAGRTGAEETGEAHRNGDLRHVFYAPSPAAAKAQYWALRQLGPIIPSRSESDAPFTLAQLQAQLAQFPDDTTLHGQPALHPDEDVTAESGDAAPVVVEAEPIDAPEAVITEAGQEQETAAEAEPEPPSNVVPIRSAAANDVIPGANVDAEPHDREMGRQPASGAIAFAEPGPAAASSGALALALAELEPTPHAMPDREPTAEQAPLSLVSAHATTTGDEPHAHEPMVTGVTTSREDAVEPLVPDPISSGAEIAEPLVPEPVATEAARPDPLGPITVAGTVASRARRRKSGVFGGLMRVLMLLIVLGAVILGVGLATGTWDGPTLLAQARTLPDQVRTLSVVKSLFP
jgi:hypothetical protein